MLPTVSLNFVASYFLLYIDRTNSFQIHWSPSGYLRHHVKLPTSSSPNKMTLTRTRVDTLLYADVLVKPKQDSLEATQMKEEDETSTRIDTLLYYADVLADSLEATQTKEEDGKSKMTARLFILLAACLYGTNYTCVKVIGENLPIQMGAALRFSVASIATLPWLLKRSESLKTDSVEYSGIDNGNDFGVLLAGAEVGLWNSIGFFGQAMGLQTTPASTSAFICSLAVVIVPIIDFLAGKKILAREVVGALLAVVGVAFLEMDGLKEDLAAGGSLLSPGTLYSLLQPLAFGFGFWRMEHWARKYPEGGMQLTASMMLSIASLMVMNSLVSLGGVEGLPEFDQFAAWLSNPTILGATLWTGIVTTVIPTFLETKALKFLSASETTMLYSTEPIFGSLFAAYVLSESMGIGGGIGATMVLSGCLYSSLGPAQLQREEN